MALREISQRDARRIAIAAQLLTADRPKDLVATVEQLSLLQIDPTAAIAPSVDVVLWSRLGNDYRPEHLTAALEEDRSLYELNAIIRPVSALPHHLPAMTGPPWEKARDWMEANASFRRDVLTRLRKAGPMLSSGIPDTSEVPWQSTGWTNDRNVTQMLEFLAMGGEVAIAGREGRQRLWDLASRVYPTTVSRLSPEQAERRRKEVRLRSLGIAREKTTQAPVERWDVGEVGVEVTVKGVPGTWRVDPDAFGRPFDGRTALLSPFDRLVHDRVRAEQLFGFEYILEMYKPEKDRRWGYFALPILRNDRLIGKLDAKADRKDGVLRVNAIHEDEPFSKAATADMHREIKRLAEWLELEVAGL